MVENSNTNFGSRREAREIVLGILYAADNHDQDLIDYSNNQPVPLEEFV